MSRPRVIALDEVLRDPVAFFHAARSEGQQEVRDADGTFIITYQKDSTKPDAREFLARGGATPDKT